MNAVEEPVKKIWRSSVASAGHMPASRLGRSTRASLPTLLKMASPTDFRRHLDTTIAELQSRRDVLGEDPLSGHLFLFANRDRTRIKILVWDGSGWWVCAKRLEKGRFAWPLAGEGSKRIAMRGEELTMLLSGIDLRQTKPRKWFRRDAAA